MKAHSAQARIRTARRIALVTTLTAASVAAVACRTDLQGGIDSANDLLYHKQYVDAERLYRKLLKRLENKSEPDETEEAQQLYILDRLGKINAIYLHDYDQAIADYQRLVRRYPKSEQAFSARAMVADIYHHKLGNLRSAIDEYQRLVNEFPHRPETKRPLLKIAAAYQQLKNYDQARTEAETLINRWPDTPEASQARFQIANTFYIQGRYAEAIATYEILLEKRLESNMEALVLFELGNCFQELGEPDRALDYYYTCLADHPNPMLVQRKIRRVRTRLRRVQPASSVHNARRVRGLLSKRHRHASNGVAAKRDATPKAASSSQPANAASAPSAQPDAKPDAKPDARKVQKTATKTSKQSSNADATGGGLSAPEPAAKLTPKSPESKPANEPANEPRNVSEKAPKDPPKEDPAAAPPPPAQTRPEPPANTEPTP